MRKKMLVMSHGIGVGGVEKSLVNFLRFLVSTDRFDIDLYLWQKNGALANQIPQTVKVIDRQLGPRELMAEKPASGICAALIERIWYFLFRVSRKMGRQTLFLRKLKKSYDVAISYTDQGIGTYYVMDKVSADRKIAWYHQACYNHSDKRSRLDAGYYGKYDRIVTVSNFCRSVLGEAFPAEYDKITVIPNLIDETSIQKQANDSPGNHTENRTVIVTVSRLAQEKGLDWAFMAAKQLHHQGLDFIWYFVGDGPEEETYRMYIEENHLTNVCALTGATDNPYAYIARADVYVQPSILESEGMAIKEAKLLKKFIVATDIPAVRENLQEGQLGLLCELSGEGVASGISRILTDAELRTRLKMNQERQEPCNLRAQKNILELLS